MYTAVDFAGPLYLCGKEVNDGVDQSVYMLCVTCCALELVLDMSTATIIRCIKRLAARQGLHKNFLSDNADNAKTFKSAAKVLKTICDHPDVQGYLSLSGNDSIWRRCHGALVGWPIREDDQIHKYLSL